MARKPGAPIQCSFCGAGPEHYARIVAGEAVYICDECVGICCDIIADRPLRESRVLVQRLYIPTRKGEVPAVTCQLCRAPAVEGKRLWIGDRGWVCKLCVELVRGMPEPPRPRLVPPLEK